MKYQRFYQLMFCLGLITFLLTGCGKTQIPPTITPTTVPPTKTATIIPPTQTATPIPPTQTTTPIPPTQTASPIPPSPNPESKSELGQVLFVIYGSFEESEYGKPLAILEEKGFDIIVASTTLDIVKGHKGLEVQPDILLSDVHASDYLAIVFIGGYAYLTDDPEAQRITKEAVAEEKLLAAICIAPITFAKAGIVEGKHVTASGGYLELKKAGAIFSNVSVERDGLIITANGPGASQEFGEAIAAALQE